MTNRSDLYWYNRESLTQAVEIATGVTMTGSMAGIIAMRDR